MLGTTEDVQRLGRRAFAVLLIGGAGLGIGLDILAAVTGAPLSPVVSAVAAIGLLLGPRRRPRGLAIAVGAGLAGTGSALLLGITGLPGFTELGALLVLVAGTVRRAPPRIAVAGVAAALVDTALMAVRAASTGLGWTVLVATWLVVAVGTGTGLFLRYMTETSALQAAGAAREARLSLARELHDGVAHHVTGMVVQAQAAQLVMSDRPDAARAALEAIERDGAAAMAAVRRVVGALRQDGDAPLAPAVTPADVRALVADVDATGPRVRLEMDDAALPAEVVPTLHRVVQESLTNVRRHADGATLVEVDVHADRAVVRLRIRDDGRPQVRRPGGGFGLTGLAERVAALGGQLRAGPGAGGGWEVEAWIPAAR